MMLLGDPSPPLGGAAAGLGGGSLGSADPFPALRGRSPVYAPIATRRTALGTSLVPAWPISSRRSSITMRCSAFSCCRRPAQCCRVAGFELQRRFGAPKFPGMAAGRRHARKMSRLQGQRIEGLARQLGQELHQVTPFGCRQDDSTLSLRSSCITELAFDCFGQCLYRAVVKIRRRDGYVAQTRRSNRSNVGNVPSHQESTQNSQGGIFVQEIACGYLGIHLRDRQELDQPMAHRARGTHRCVISAVGQLRNVGIQAMARRTAGRTD